MRPQAEESGENTQLLDDALYALQGLSAGASAATRRDCALTLADIAATQRGRRTLRYDMRTSCTTKKIKPVAASTIAQFRYYKAVLCSPDAGTYLHRL